MLRVLVLGLVALVGALFLFPGAPPPVPETATLLSDPRPLPQVRLTDQTGGGFATADLDGRFSLLFFGFTHCPDICPITLSVLARVRENWAAPGVEPPEVVFVSVDPERDDPGRIREYLAGFHAGFRGVTGPPEDMAPWLEALGVTVHAQPSADGRPYNVTHNATVYVVGPGTELLAVFSPPHDAAVIAADFLKIHRRYLEAPRGAADSAAP